MGSDESHCNVSSLWGTKSQDSGHRPQLLKRKESWSGFEPRSLCPYHWAKLAPARPGQCGFKVGTEALLVMFRCLCISFSGAINCNKTCKMAHWKHGCKTVWLITINNILLYLCIGDDVCMCGNPVIMLDIFLNQCYMYKVVKVAHGNGSDNPVIQIYSRHSC